MTNKQQELYDNLLKKVNEYCLGFAAEDVIESIDALVENYEDVFTELATVREGYQNCMKEWQSGHSVDFSKVRFEIQNLLPDPVDIEKKLKALEIIKEKLMPYVEKYKDLGYVIECDMIAIGIPQEEYDLLKEILK